MGFNQETIQPIYNNANVITGVLNAAGYPSQIVGGALRVLALGGTTGDVDIAVLLEDFTDLNRLQADLRILIQPLGYDFALQHCSGLYSDSDGFVADWRCGDINIIAYNTERFTNGFTSLIGQFDLNINQWYFDAHDNLVNDYYVLEEKKVLVNPERDGGGRVNRFGERIARFKEALPHLDWSEVSQYG